MVSIVVLLLGLPFRILHIKWVKPKKGTTMETIGSVLSTYRRRKQGVAAARDPVGVGFRI